MEFSDVPEAVWRLMTAAERAELEREVAGVTDPSVVRRDCVWCGRERSRRDDNHADDCPYWRFFEPKEEL